MAGRMDLLEVQRWIPDLRQQPLDHAAVHLAGGSRQGCSRPEALFEQPRGYSIILMVSLHVTRILICPNSKTNTNSSSSSVHRTTLSTPSTTCSPSTTRHASCRPNSRTPSMLYLRPGLFPREEKDPQRSRRQGHRCPIDPAETRPEMAWWMLALRQEAPGRPQNLQFVQSID